MNRHTPQQRWYDRNRRVSQAVETIIDMPEAFQRVICHTIMTLAEQQEAENKSGTRSLGRDKVLMLYKSKQKKRHYDKIADTHSTLNYMGTLDEEKQSFLAKAVLDLRDLVEAYLCVCQRTHVAAEAEDLYYVSETYIIEGKDSAQELLLTFEEELSNRRQKQEASMVSHSSLFNERITDCESDLRIEHKAEQ